MKLTAKVLLLLVCATGMNVRAQTATQSKKEEASSLLAKAVELTAMETPGSPPFRLRARVRATGLKGPDVQGTYLFAWAAPERFREEIALASFHETSVALGDKLWRARSLDFRPLRVWQALDLVHLAGQLSRRPGDRLKKVAGSTHCMEIERAEEIRWVMCLDPLTAAPVRLVFYDWDARCEFSSFEQVGTKYFPRELRAFHMNELAVEMHIEQIDQPPSFPDQEFTPPVDGTSHAWCPHPTNPRPIQFTMGPVEPRIRGHARSAITGTIGTDGHLHNVMILEAPAGSSPFPIGTGSFVTATCNGVPVESEFLAWVGKLM